MTILIPTLSEKAKETVDAAMKRCMKRNEPIIFSSFYHSLNIRGLITNVSASYFSVVNQLYFYKWSFFIASGSCKLPFCKLSKRFS